jgi:hypothetical protein
MERQFIEAKIQMATYERKEGTATSCYWKSGTKILPNRLGITRDQFAIVRRTGRNLQKKVGQIKARFNKSESSPLMQNSPFDIHTQIWEIPEYPDLIGYGSVGITNKQGKIDRSSDTEDLIILASKEKDWNRIDIYYFAKGLMNLPEIASFVHQKIRGRN